MNAETLKKEKMPFSLGSFRNTIKLRKTLSGTLKQAGIQEKKSLHALKANKKSKNSKKNRLSKKKDKAYKKECTIDKAKKFLKPLKQYAGACKSGKQHNGDENQTKDSVEPPERDQEKNNAKTIFVSLDFIEDCHYYKKKLRKTKEAPLKDVKESVRSLASSQEGLGKKKESQKSTAPVKSQSENVEKGKVPVPKDKNHENGRNETMKKAGKTSLSQLSSDDIAKIDRLYLEKLLSLTTKQEDQKKSFEDGSESGDSQCQLEKKKVMTGKDYFVRKMRTKELQSQISKNVQGSSSANGQEKNGLVTSGAAAVSPRVVRDSTKSEEQILLKKGQNLFETRKGNLKKKSETHSRPDINEMDRKARKPRNKFMKSNCKEIVDPSLPGEVSKVADVKELWRRNTLLRKSENSLTSHSSCTVPETDEYFESRDLDSYKILKKLVEDEINNIMKKSENKDNAKDETKDNDPKLGERKKNKDSGSPLPEGMNPNKLNGLPILKRRLLQAECERQLPKPPMLSFLTEDIPKEANPRLAELEEKAKGRKIPSKVIENWNILHRLEQAFLGLGTPTFPDRNPKNFTSLKPKSPNPKGEINQVGEKVRADGTKEVKKGENFKDLLSKRENKVSGNQIPSIQKQHKAQSLIKTVKKALSASKVHSPQEKQLKNKQIQKTTKQETPQGSLANATKREGIKKKKIKNPSDPPLSKTPPRNTVEPASRKGKKEQNVPNLELFTPSKARLAYIRAKFKKLSKKKSSHRVPMNSNLKKKSEENLERKKTFNVISVTDASIDHPQKSSSLNDVNLKGRSSQKKKQDKTSYDVFSDEVKDERKLNSKTNESDAVAKNKSNIPKRLAKNLPKEAGNCEQQMCENPKTAGEKESERPTTVDERILDRAKVVGEKEISNLKSEKKPSNPNSASEKDPLNDKIVYEKDPPNDKIVYEKDPLNDKIVYEKDPLNDEIVQEMDPLKIVYEKQSSKFTKNEEKEPSKIEIVYEKDLHKLKFSTEKDSPYPRNVDAAAIPSFISAYENVSQNSRITRDPSKLQVVGGKISSSFKMADKKDPSNLKKSVEKVSSSPKTSGEKESPSLNPTDGKDSSNLEIVDEKVTSNLKIADEQDSSKHTLPDEMRSWKVKTGEKEMVFEKNSWKSINGSDSVSLNTICKKDSWSTTTPDGSESRSLKTPCEKDSSKLNVIGAKDSWNLNIIDEKNSINCNTVHENLSSNLSNIGQDEYLKDVNETVSSNFNCTVENDSLNLKVVGGKEFSHLNVAGAKDSSNHSIFGEKNSSNPKTVNEKISSKFNIVCEKVSSNPKIVDKKVFEELKIVGEKDSSNCKNIVDRICSNDSGESLIELPKDLIIHEVEIVKAAIVKELSKTTPQQQQPEIDPDAIKTDENSRNCNSTSDSNSTTKERAVKKRSFLSVHVNQTCDQPPRVLVQIKEKDDSDMAIGKPKDNNVAGLAMGHRASDSNTSRVSTLTYNLPERNVPNYFTDKFSQVPSSTPPTDLSTRLTMSLSKNSISTDEHYEQEESASESSTRKKQLWEKDLAHYRSIVRDIMNHYKRIDGFLTQSDQTIEVPNEVSSEEVDSSLFNSQMNIEDYRKKIVSEYTELPVLEYRTKLLQNCSYFSTNSRRTNLLVAKEVKRDADLDVKDYVPNIQKVLDSQLYVDTERLVKRNQVNGNRKEKNKSFQELKMTKSEKKAPRKNWQRSCSLSKTSQAWFSSGNLSAGKTLSFDRYKGSATAHESLSDSDTS